MVKADEKFFETGAEAQPGSSGSPVFLDWNLCGVAHSVVLSSGMTSCTHIGVVMERMGMATENLQREKTEFPNRHRLKVELPSTNEFHFLSSLSKYHAVDVSLLSQVKDNALCFVQSKTPGLLRVSDVNDSDPPPFTKKPTEVYSPRYCFWGRKKPVATLSSSTMSKWDFGIKVLDAKILSFDSRAVPNTMRCHFNGTFEVAWIALENVKGINLKLDVSVTSGDVGVYVQLLSLNDMFKDPEDATLTSRHLKHVKKSDSFSFFSSESGEVFVQVISSSKSSCDANFKLSKANLQRDCKGEKECSICGSNTSDPPPPPPKAPQPPAALPGTHHVARLWRLNGSARDPNSILVETEHQDVLIGNVAIDHGFMSVRKCMTQPNGRLVVAKTLRPEASHQYHDVGPLLVSTIKMHAFATDAAHHWNIRCKAAQALQYQIRFSQALCYQISSRNEKGILEDDLNPSDLKDAFRQVTGVDGRRMPGVSDEEWDQISAFMHFGLTGGPFLICRLQGVRNVFSLPFVHGFEHPRNNPKLIEEFRTSHKCKQICKLLNLT